MSRFFHVLLSILSIAISLGISEALYAASTYHPVAAVKGTSGALFLLTTEGTVLAVNLNLPAGQIVGSFKLAVAGAPTDMAYGIVGAKEMLFIACNDAVGGKVLGKVYAFTTDGHLIGSWVIFNHTVAGLTYDAPNQTVYFTSGDSPEVYRILSQPHAQPQFVGEVIGSKRLGTVAVDSAHQQLYVSDVSQGAVFSMRLNGPHVVAIVGYVGMPQALLMDMNTPRLMVADSAHGQIVSLSIAGHLGPPHPLTPRGTFKAPAGLAWEDPLRLIVSDQRAGSVTLLGPAGDVLYSLTLRY